MKIRECNLNLPAIIHPALMFTDDIAMQLAITIASWLAIVIAIKTYIDSSHVAI